MGVAVSTSIPCLSTRQRFSQGPRESNTSVLHNTIVVAESTDAHPLPSLQQHSLGDPFSSKSNAPINTTASLITTATTTTTAADEMMREPLPHILHGHRINPNTFNSVDGNMWNSEATMSPFTRESPIACRLESSQRNSFEINAHNNILENGEPATAAETEKSAARSAPPKTVRRDSPKLPAHRTLRREDVASLTKVSSSNNGNSKPTTTTSVAPCGPHKGDSRHSNYLSCLDCHDDSKAIIATSNFKTTTQQLYEEPRSRGNSLSLNNRSMKDDSFGKRSSHEERQTNGTQLSTDEWSHLPERMDITEGNVLVSAADDDGPQQRPKSNKNPKVDTLPQYAATDTIPFGDQPQVLPPLLAPTTSVMTDDAYFTPLKMGFPLANSFFSAPPNPEMDLQRALTGVDAYAAKMRKLLTSWHGIVSHHFDDFVKEMGTVLALQHPMFSHGVPVDASTEDYARMMLRMVCKTVQLVSQMEDMCAGLLEMGAMHRRHNVGTGHFEALHQAFMQVLPHYVPDDERKTLCDAVWEPFWQLVVGLLSQGNRSERGDWYAAQRRTEWLADARAVLKAVSEQQQSSDYRDTFVPAMLSRVDAANPAAAELFLLQEPRLAVRFFENITFIAIELDNDAGRIRYVEQLAHENIVYGLSERGMRALRQPFIDTNHYFVQLSANPDAWTPTAAESLGLFWDMVTQYCLGAIAVSRRSLTNICSLRAPDGSRPFCMMFTDIEAGSRLWERCPSMMSEAVDAHNRVIRKLIADYGAYEVKTDGDSFEIATKDVFSALQIAVSTQLELMRGPIVEGFRMVPVVQGGGVASCWRNDSLRVRIGIHYCTDASAVYDRVQRRFDYYGPSVRCAARTAAIAAGGQILITQEAVNALLAVRTEKEESPMPIASIPPGSNPLDTVLDNLLEFQWWGEHRFHGVSDPVHLYSVLPMRLAGRTFPYYVGNRKVRVSAPSDFRERREVHHLSLTQLGNGNLDESSRTLLR